nr:hypothetical protein GCM10020092_041180 [Actinoplanes digitatis]
MVDKYPDITDYKNLNKYADLFKTSESKGKGQLLDGDPSFVTNDAALVGNLKLNYEVVFSGSEAAIIKAAQQATAQTKPLLFYFYEPQWLFAKEKYVRVKLLGVHRRLRRRPQEGRLRLPRLHPRQDRQQEVRRHEQHGVPAGQELPMDQRGPEPRLRLHHQPGHDRRSSRREVGQGTRGHLEAVDPLRRLTDPS